MAATSGVRLRSLDGESFWFDPGAFCLEFALTGGEGYRAAYETLHSTADLRRWIQTSLGVEVERVSSADLAEAKRVREAIWQLADARVLRRAAPAAAAEALNRSAARPPLAPQINSAGARAWASPVTPGQVISTIARDAVELFTGPMAHRIRRCAGTNCLLIFVDTSRPGRRRWCSMERCGNRAKVRTFRNRQHKEDPP